jgi:DHA2 family multidrug resistance protein
MPQQSDYLNYTVFQRWMVFITVILGAILEILDTTIVSTCVPQMQGNLGATLDEIGWVSTGYIVANVIVLPLTGWLSGRFGRRQYLAASMAFFTFSSFMCGRSSSLWELVFWRVMQGLGGAALISTAQAVLFSVFPQKQTNLIQALFGMVLMVAPTVGPTLGGYIADNYNWPWVFFINVPLGTIGVFLTLTFLRDNPLQQVARKVDFIGIILMAVALGCLQTVLEKGNREDWFDSPLIVQLSITSVVALVSFIIWELRNPAPAVNLRILNNKAFLAGWLFNFCVGTALYASVFIFPLWMQNLRGYTAQETGMNLIPRGLTTAVVALVTVRLTTKVPARLLIGCGAMLNVIAMLYFNRVTLSTGPDQLIWPMIIQGCALGMLVLPTSIVTLGALKPQEVPNGAGLFNLMRQLGGSVGIAVAATLLDHWTQQTRGSLTEHVNPFNPAYQEQARLMEQALQAKGTVPAVAHDQALAVLDRMVQSQASIMAFEMVYFALAMVFIFALPLLIFIKTPKSPSAAADAH